MNVIITLIISILFIIGIILLIMGLIKLIKIAFPMLKQILKKKRIK